MAVHIEQKFFGDSYIPVELAWEEEALLRRFYHGRCRVEDMPILKETVKDVAKRDAMKLSLLNMVEMDWLMWNGREDRNFSRVRAFEALY
jgi:hypothetical protein